ncbi:MAG: helix-turn-helix domain-containing protein [Thermoleophilaceae bacterium]|jgi:excisionase family DNA binding protein
MAFDAEVALSLDEPLLDCEQAAALLNVRTSWVRDATRAGRLPCIRVGRHLRFTRPMLESWAATHRIDAGGAPGRPRAGTRRAR